MFVNKNLVQNLKTPRECESSERFQRPRLVRVGPMEVRHELLRVSELRSENPGRLLVRAFVARPSDQIEELTGATPSVYLGVQNLRDLILRFAVHLDRRWRRLSPTGNGVQSCGLQLRNVEDRVHGAHRVRKAQGEGVRTDLRDNGVGSEELLRKLLGRAR